MEFTLNKSQRLVTNAAAKDESRPVLTCVHIRKGIIEAANGYTLVQKHIDYDGNEELLIKAKELAKCKDKEGKVTFSKGEGNEIRAVGQETIILEAQSGKFPNAASLYPKTVGDEVLERLRGKGPFKVALSAMELLNVLRSTDEHILKLYFYGGSKPVEFRIGDIRGMIMPMQVNWEEN